MQREEGKVERESQGFISHREIGGGIDRVGDGGNLRARGFRFSPYFFSSRFVDSFLRHSLGCCHWVVRRTGEREREGMVMAVPRTTIACVHHDLYLYYQCDNYTEHDGSIPSLKNYLDLSSLILYQEKIHNIRSLTLDYK